LNNKVHENHRIVSLSGTSGGAICAALAWHGLLKWAKGDKNPVGLGCCERLTPFGKFIKKSIG
jgi:hypothetical protein